MAVFRARMASLSVVAALACPKAAAVAPVVIAPVVTAPVVVAPVVIAPVAAVDAGDDDDDDEPEEGVASFYADMLTGRPTASGDLYRPDKSTCAHRTEELGTVVEVTNTDNGKKARCRVNDRGPNDDEHVIDLSKKVARALGMIGPNVADVSIRVAEDQTDPDR